MPSSSSSGQSSCHNHSHADRELETLDNDIMPLPMKPARRSTTWSSTAPTRVNTLDHTESKRKAPCPLDGFENIELQELGDVVTPLHTRRSTCLSGKTGPDQSGFVNCNLNNSSRANQLDCIAPTISPDSSEPISTMTKKWEWRQGHLYTHKDPQERLNEPVTRRDSYLKILPSWGAIAKTSKQTADNFSVSKYKSGSDTAKFFDLETQERGARERYSEASLAWDGCMSNLYGRSMDAASRTTAKMLGSIKKEQRKRHGRCTEVDCNLLGNTLTEALSRHFDKTLIEVLDTWRHSKPINKKEKKKAAAQLKKLDEIKDALQYGTISMSGDRDSITCTWTSRTIEQRGVPGPSIMWRKKSKDHSEVVAQTEWTWRDGKVNFVEAEEDSSLIGDGLLGTAISGLYNHLPFRSSSTSTRS